MRNLQIDNLLSDLTRTAAFQGLVSRVASTSAAPGVVRLSGLTLTAKALYAVLLHRATGRPQLIVVDGNKQAETLLPLLQTFADLIEPGSPPVFLPALDVLPGTAHVAARRNSGHARHGAGQAGERVQRHHAGAGGGRARRAPRRRHTTGSSRSTCGCRTKCRWTTSPRISKASGMSGAIPVEMVGEYSIRGGILDVFSPEQEQPVRIEFFGDEIESIRRFDPESQRSIHKLNECVLQPLTRVPEISRCCRWRTFAHGPGGLPELASRSPAGSCWSRRAPAHSSLARFLRTAADS